MHYDVEDIFRKGMGMLHSEVLLLETVWHELESCPRTISKQSQEKLI